MESNIIESNILIPNPNPSSDPDFISEATISDPSPDPDSDPSSTAIHSNEEKMSIHNPSSISNPSHIETDFSEENILISEQINLNIDNDTDK